MKGILKVILSDKKERIFLKFVILTIFIFPYLSFAIDLYPGFYYDSIPYEIDKYNTSEVIENAKNIGYAIKIQTSPGVCIDDYGVQHEICAGKIRISPPTYEYVNTNDSKSFENSNKQLFVVNSSIAIRLKYDAFELTASSLNSLENLSVWWSQIIAKTDNTTIEDVTEVIVNELLLLGIIDETITLEFREGYSPTIPSSAFPFSGNTEYLNRNVNNYLSFFMIVIIILVLVIAYFIKKRHGK